MKRHRAPPSWARPLGFAALACALIAFASSACTALLDSSSKQCANDDECRARGGDFASTLCGPSGRCVVAVPATDGGSACATNKECIDQNHGMPTICRQKDHRCAPLLSPDCYEVIGDVSNDSVVIFGSVFNTKGVNGPSGIARQNAAKVALSEIARSVSGIPGGPEGRPRPLALVACDETDDSMRPTKYLVDVVGVPAILGVSSSGRIIDVAKIVTVPAGVLLISPTTTGTTITTLDDHDLVWRTAPSDALQAVALIDQMGALETKYRSENSLPPTATIAAAFIYINDAYGAGLYDAIRLDARINGQKLSDASNQGLLQVVNYEANPVDLAAQVAKVLAQNPRPALIAGLGSGEIITKFIDPLETQWGTSAPRPLYLLADAGQKPELLALAGKNDDLRRRVRGSVPVAPVGSVSYDAFIGKYEGMFGAPAPRIFGMAGAYDSVFLLAYLATGVGSAPLTGEAMEKQFARLVTGTKIEVGGTAMNDAFRILQSGGSFDFGGASGPLDFDLATGDARSNIDVWCVGKDAAGAPIYRSSGRLFDAATNMMSGAYDTTVCP
jgi:branched-chain amino acid transport system substrate-binding protein